MNKQSLLLRETSPPTGKQLGRQLPYVIRVILVEGQVQLEPSKRGPYDSLGGSVSLLWVVFCGVPVWGVFLLLFFARFYFYFFHFLNFFQFRHLSKVCLGVHLFPGSWELVHTLGKMPFPGSTLSLGPHLPRVPASLALFLDL